MKLCRRKSGVYGAGVCPRAHGHSSECYWFISWQDGRGIWHAIVYSGPPAGRRRRCRGTFTEKPGPILVNRLLRTLAPIKRLEVARRTPASEPAPVHAIPLRVDCTPSGRPVAVPM